MIEYTVKVWENGNKGWYLNGQLHRTDGPAFEGADGSKEWWINGKRYSTEAEWRFALNSAPCHGKTVEIDGVTYMLTAI